MRLTLCIDWLWVNQSSTETLFHIDPMTSRQCFECSTSMNTSSSVPMSHSSSTSSRSPRIDSALVLDCVAGEDEFRRFHEKRKMSKKAIKNFFGESVPVDVPINVVEQKGLAAILQSHIPLCYFLYSLLVDMNAENLFFYLEVEQFEEHLFKSPESRKKTSMYLYKTFIEVGSDFEINLEGSVRELILPMINEDNINCFSKARDHVVHLLIPCFENFTLGPIYKRMVEDLGERTTIYSKDQRNGAIKLFLEYLDRAPKSLIVADDKTEKRRRMLLKEMVHDFCRKRLHCDFKDKDKELVEDKTTKKTSDDVMSYAT